MFIMSANRNLFGGILQSIIIPELTDLVAPEERKRAAIGLTKLLTQSNVMLSDVYFPLW